MTALGLPDFGPVQNNISFNARRGATRGIHAEPWDKFVSVATGRVFGAWVDLREGDYLRRHVPPGDRPGRRPSSCPAASATPTRRSTDGTAYTYLVNDHWRAGTTYPALAPRRPDRRDPVADPARRGRHLGEGPREPGTDRGDADAAQAHPDPRRRADSSGARWPTSFPEAHAVDRAELDLTDAAALAAWPWHEYDVVLNAAAYTAVDAAETDDGTAGCLDGQRRRTGGPGSSGPRAPPHAGALLLRLRLRRHRGGARRGASHCHRSASTARPRPPATSP